MTTARTVEAGTNDDYDLIIKKNRVHRRFKMVISLIVVAAVKSVTIAPAVTLIVTLLQIFKPSFACEISIA